MCRVFFFNDTATTEIYTLSLHDALPISQLLPEAEVVPVVPDLRDPAVFEAEHVDTGELHRPARRLHAGPDAEMRTARDRKSTRLNSSHANISYAVFCLKKQNCIYELQSQ